MPPPRRAKTEMSEPPKASPTRSSIAGYYWVLTDWVGNSAGSAIDDLVGEHPVVARDSEQSEPDDEEAGDGSGAEGDVERGAQSVLRRLGRAHVGAHGDEHAD